MQTLLELEKQKEDPARLQELRAHLLRLGAAESKLAGFRQHNGAAAAEGPASNGVALPASSVPPLDRDQRQDVLDTLRVSLRLQRLKMSRKESYWRVRRVITLKLNRTKDDHLALG